MSRMQFNDYLVQPNQSLDDYPLLDIYVDDETNLPPRAAVFIDPAERAQMISLRIYGMGAFGVMLVGAGVAVPVIARRKAKKEEI